MVLWSVLKSPLVLGSRFVATSLLAFRVDWLVSAWCRFSAGGDFQTDSSSSSPF